MSRIRTNFITNRMANGAPTVSNGLVISGVTTCNSTANQTLLVNNTASNGQSSIAFQSAGATKFIVGSNKDGDSNRDFFIYDVPTNTHRFNIDASGKVGINTTSPSQMLTVRGTILKTRSDSGTGLIYLSNDADNNGNIVINQNSGVTRIKLDSDGDTYFNGGSVGINTTTPHDNFSIAGNLRFINPNNTVSRVSALPTGAYSLGVSGGSAIAFHRTADGGGGSDEIAFETHYQGNRHGEVMRLDKHDTVLIGASTARTDFITATLRPKLQIASSWNAYASLTRFDNSQWAPYLVLAKTRGGSYNSNGIVQNNDYLGGIVFEGNDGSVMRTGARIRAQVSAAPGAGDMPTRLVFGTTKDGQNNVTDNLTISSEGYVTNAAQPSFNVTSSGGQINSNVGTIVFTDTTSVKNHNVGNHYSTSTGRFTAPIAGRYQINARMLTNSSTTSYTIYLLRVNGTNVGYIGHNHSDYWIMESGSFVLNLSANDYVECYMQQHSGHLGHNYASFSGFLIA